jgi:hypothetical protein
MKPDDPFGRVGRRQEAGYAALKSQLLAEGVHEVAALDAVTQRMTRMAFLFIAIVVVVTLSLALLLRPWRVLVGIFGGIALLWLGTTLIRTRMHLRRYRRELSRIATDASASPRDNHPPGGPKP